MKNKESLELSQLAIERTSNSKVVRQSRNYYRIAILALLSLSLYIIVQVLFFPKTPTKALKQQVTVKTQLNADEQKSLAYGSLDNNKPIIASQTKASNAVSTVLDASGHIVARRIATVSSRVTGKLNLLNIEEGQRVNNTEVLAELDDTQAMITYQLALAELSATQASYDEFTLLFQQQSQRYNRNKSLAARQLISQQLLEDSEFKHAQLAIQIKHKQARVHSATQKVELAQYQLNQHKIRAPFDGVVISKNAQVGELISAGSSGGGFIRTGVGTIVDMSSLEIEVEVGESYINRVFAGQQVIAKLDAYPKWNISSEVVAVIPTADRQKASIKVRVKLLEVDERILPDMGVKVSFLSKVAEKKHRSTNHIDIASL